MDVFSGGRHTRPMPSLVTILLPPETQPPAVGKRLRAFREALCMSQAEFADAIGLDRSSMTRIEKGNAGLSIRTGMIVRRLYGVGLDFIYMGDLSDLPFDLRAAVLDKLLNPSKAE